MVEKAVLQKYRPKPLYSFIIILLNKRTFSITLLILLCKYNMLRDDYNNYLLLSIVI